MFKDRLFVLAGKKEKLKTKFNKIKEQINKINKEALSLREEGNTNKDLFISCLVNDLHFEKVEE